MSAARPSTVSGDLRPSHTVGTGAVRLYLWLHTSSGWSPRGYVNARVIGSRYSAAVRLPNKGRWRMMAYHADDGHAAARSGYSYVTVQ